jgi:redox-sensitive bicupin YhaK (pirin superfamily)
MNRTPKISSGGRNEKVADMLVNRLLPNDQAVKVGPFVFLGHMYPILLQKREPETRLGHYAHPNRGMVILSYLLSGCLQYADSHQNRGAVNSGGLLWRNAGKGIIHEERPGAGSLREGGLFHMIQFWINLPAINKQEDPECRTLSAGDIPELELPDNAGALKVLLGSCGVRQAPLKIFLNEFIYHIRLNPKSSFSFPGKQDMEYAAFVPADDIRINDHLIGKSHLLIFSKEESTILFYNPSISVTDVFLFGGHEYSEPVMVGGPFVMNTRNEIAQAYGDFFAGKYGELNSDKALGH